MAGRGGRRPARTRLPARFGRVYAIQRAGAEEIAAAGWPTAVERSIDRAARLKEALTFPVFTGIVQAGGLTVLDGPGTPMSPAQLALRRGEDHVLERLEREAEAPAWVGVIG